VLLWFARKPYADSLDRADAMEAASEA